MTKSEEPGEALKYCSGWFHKKQGKTMTHCSLPVALQKDPLNQ